MATSSRTHRRRNLWRAGLLIAFCAADLGMLPPVIHAEMPSRRALAARRCHCGQWTCPICQSECDCPLPHPLPGGVQPMPAAVPYEWRDAGPMTPTPQSPPNTTPGATPTSPSPPGAIPDSSGSAANGANNLANDAAIPSQSALANEGATQLADSAGVPMMIGDNFGGGQGSVILSNTVSYAFPATGFFVSGSPGNSSSTLVFEVGNSQLPDDLYSIGQGRINQGNNGVDQYDVAEPVAPTDAPTSPGPNFVYDGGTATHTTGTYSSIDTWNIAYSYSEPIRIVLPGPSGGGVVVGRAKLAENGSPLPRNRIFFNYSLFDNVPLLAGGVTVNRFTPGFESTFAQGLGSVELRVPFASTSDNTILSDGPTDRTHFELGDMFISLKALLWQDRSSIVSGGMSFTVPTADDLLVTTRAGNELLRVSNHTVHLQPFVGGYRQLTQRAFTQGFLQLDIDSNGNPVQARVRGNSLHEVGRLQDPTFLYVDWGVGYRYQPSQRPTRGLTQIIPMAELHYTRSLQDNDVIEVGRLQIGQAKDSIQILNAVIGTAFEFNRTSMLTCGYATPLGNSADRLFDGELRVFWNRLY